MSDKSDLEKLMERVRASKEQHDPKNDFTDAELAEILLIAEQPLEYWMYIAKHDEEPADDYGLRANIDAVKDTFDQKLCSSDELLGLHNRHD